MEDSNVKPADESVETPSEVSEMAENAEAQGSVNQTTELSLEDEIACLRKVHEFLREYDRVPGALASTWSQMLDTIAVVANSLISKLNKSA